MFDTENSSQLWGFARILDIFSEVTHIGAAYVIIGLISASKSVWHALNDNDDLSRVRLNEIRALVAFILRFLSANL